MPKAPKQAFSIFVKEVRNEIDFFYMRLVWPGVLKAPKQQVCNMLEMLDYLDFWYVRRPPSHQNNLPYVNQRLLQMIIFI